MNTTPRIDLRRSNSWPGHVWLILAHGLVFAAFGPAIGTFLSPGVVVYPIAVIVAYRASLEAALVTGMLVGAISPFLREDRAIYAFGMMTGAVCAMAFPFAFSGEAPVGMLLMYAVAGSFAGLVCTRLTRWLRLRWLRA
jgi:hypothetical protein